MIIPIELNSIQPLEVVSVVRVICWNNQDDHDYYRNQACLSYYMHNPVSNALYNPSMDPKLTTIFQSSSSLKV